MSIENDPPNGAPAPELGAPLPGDAAPGSGAPPIGEPSLPWFDGTLSVVVAEGAKPPPVPADAAPSPLAAAQRGRPRLVDCRELARGGMSRIHEVLDRNLRRRAAMKVLAAEIAGQPGARGRFLEEAQITAQLDHPNIPPVHDLWVSEKGETCFSMKLVRGRTLTEILASRGLAERTDEELERLLQIFLKVCDAVSFAHSRGVIHRDLKPDNVMVGSHGQVYVMDWGCALLRPAGAEEAVSVARDPSRSLDPPGCAIGTCSYMAPEQAKAQADALDERTDVYLLGGILYEILTLKPPHRGQDFVHSLALAQQGTVVAPAVQAAPVKLPPELCRIAMRALAPARAERYASVEELQRDVESSLRHGWWFTSVTFPAGTVVVREGDEADAAYIITSGACEAFHLQQGERAVLRRMGPGDTFGETAIFSARPRTASVEVTEEMTATVVTREALEHAVGRDSWLGAFVRVLAERFQELDARLAQQRQGDEPAG
jgi:serine/threonine-protein kinase